MTGIALVVMDMAGTTVRDDGAVERAFAAAVAEAGYPASHERFPAMLDHVRSTMGESKITVFRHLLHDDALAERANVAFEAAYGSEIEAGRIAPIDGAETSMAELRAAGIRVALTTGFSPATQRALIRALGWEDVVDLALAPADAGRGRPYPDLPLTALLRLQIDDVRAMAVVGDTGADMQSGRRAGASVVAGVLTGAHDREALVGAGATCVLPSVADLPGVLR